MNTAIMLNTTKNKALNEWLIETIHKLKHGQLVAKTEEKEKRIGYSFGFKYEGEFKAGKQHGLGKKNYVNGDEYEGEF